MDLFLQLGSYKTIPEMLNTLDANEYDFLLEKYRKMTFGPSMVNHQLAQIAYVQANSFSKSHVRIEQLIMGEIGDLQATDADKVAIGMMFNNYFRYYMQEGYNKHEATELADKDAKKYAADLRQKRLEEQLLDENSQDLGSS